MTENKPLPCPLIRRDRAVRPRDDRSRMNGDVHVRFWESLGVKSPWATQPVIIWFHLGLTLAAFV